MTIWYLYFLLPVLLFSAVGTINVLFGRKIWARKLSLYRQLTVTVAWIPILYSILQKPHVLQEHILILIACGLLWAWYLTIAFHAMNLTSIGISRSFVAVSRTITGFIIGYTLFWENISLYDLVWILWIWLGFYILSNASGEKLNKNDVLWITFSLIWWVIFTMNALVFKEISQYFSAIEAAYILEASSFLPLLWLYIITKKETFSTSIKKDYKKIFILFATAPLILLASYGLAKSINIIPFYIINTLFVLVLVVSMILSWIFLKEKFTLKQLWAIWCMVVSCWVIIML
jgi:drug/metabolite transporter (DMT)-like permease